MRNRRFRRVGALWLSLLLQVLVLSGFIHPCCLAGGAGADVDHAGHESGHETSVAVAHSVVDGAHVHQAGFGSEGGADSSLRPIASAELETPSDHGCGNCEDGCGFCSLVVGEAALPAPIAVARVVQAAPAPVRHDRADSQEVPSVDPFLLPFAIGPPFAAPISV